MLTSAFAAVEEARPTAAGDFGRKRKTSGGSERELGAVGRSEEIGILFSDQASVSRNAAGARACRRDEDRVGVGRMV